MPVIITEVILALSDILYSINQKFMEKESMVYTVQRVFEVLMESDKRK